VYVCIFDYLLLLLDFVNVIAKLNIYRYYEHYHYYLCGNIKKTGLHNKCH
jgi:hypothetical protein